MSGILNMLLASRGDVLGHSQITVNAVETNPTEAIAAVRFDNDGNIYTSNSNPESYSVYDAWIDPLTSASKYEIRVTATAGAFSSGTTGTWLALTSDRTFIRNSTSGAQSVTFTVEIGLAGTSTALFTLTGNTLAAESTP